MFTKILVYLVNDAMKATAAFGSSFLATLTITLNEMPDLSTQETVAAALLSAVGTTIGVYCAPRNIRS